MSQSVLISLIVSLGSGVPLNGNGNFANVTFDSNSSPFNQNVYLRPNYTAFMDVGYAYKFVPNKLTWNTARKHCAAEGASLVIVDTFQKINYLMGMVANPFGIHTGTHRLYDGYEWITVRDNRPPVFLPWRPEANLAIGTGDCVAMWFDGSGVGPYSCTNVLPSFCEIPIFTVNKTETQISQGPIDQITAN